jgi:hypothetical protein
MSRRSVSSSSLVLGRCGSIRVRLRGRRRGRLAQAETCSPTPQPAGVPPLGGPSTSSARQRRLVRTAVVLCLALPLALAAEDPGLQELFAAAARYESGADASSLRSLESATRAAASDPQKLRQIEDGLVALLQGDSTYEGKRFACRLLAVVGRDACVPAVAGLLKQDETVGMACLALAGHPSPLAGDALRAALPGLAGRSRVQVINALAHRHDAGAVESLVALAGDPDAMTSDAAIHALGCIATKQALDAIGSFRGRLQQDRLPAIREATMLAAERLAAEGKKDAAAILFEGLLDAKEPTFIRRGAFCALLRLDTDGGEQRALDALRGQDAILKLVAIAHVRALPSAQASEKLAAELGALPAAQRVMLLQALAARGDAAAVAAVRREAGGADGEVRLAALRLLGEVGSAEDVPALVAALPKGAQEPVVQALLALPAGDVVDRAIVGELAKAAPAEKIKLCQVLEARKSDLAVEALLKETASPDAGVAKAAFQSLGRLATADHAGAILDKLAAVSDPGVRSEAETAASRVLKGVPDAGQRAALVAGRYGGAPDAAARKSLLRLLPVAGDASALALLVAACADPDADLRDAAVRSLVTWPDMAAWDALFSTYKDAPVEAHRVLALRGMVRLASSADGQAGSALVARYRQLLEGVRTDDDRRLILGALAGVGHPEALALAVSQLSTATVRPEAEAAVRKIAAAVQAQHPVAAAEALGKLQ